MPKYHQGLYLCKNPEKYVGDVAKIVYRSSWERKFMIYADTNPQVLKWGSEELVIPYMSPVDNRVHRYFPDFIMMVQTNAGLIKKYLVEVKPEAQTLPPVAKRNTKRLYEETKTYAVNTAKWRAAEEFCTKHDLTFMVITEKHLNIK
jgi:hypothetical protein